MNLFGMYLNMMIEFFFFELVICDGKSAAKIRVGKSNAKLDWENPPHKFEGKIHRKNRGRKSLSILEGKIRRKWSFSGGIKQINGGFVRH